MLHWTGIIVVLSLASVISPLLTLLRLFQLKEWRFDRMAEHIRAEGVFRTLTGAIRPVLCALYIITVAMRPAAVDAPLVIALILLTLLGIAQTATGRQKLPVRTQKALAIGGGALVINLVIIGGLLVWYDMRLWLPLLSVLQFPVLLLSWAAFLPVDARMKQQVFQRARNIRAENPSRIAIGIVGSVGKTTTKELLTHLLTDLKPVATPEHVNTEMGVAQWFISTLPKAKTDAGPLIVEMGAYRKGEIALLSSIVHPQLGVVTALGGDHLALFGSENNIIQANGEIINYLPKHGHLFINVDTKGGHMLSGKVPCPVTRVGLQPHAAERATDITDTTDGLSFTSHDTRFTVPLRGRHHITNVLLAIAVARHLNISDARIAELLKSFKPMKNTFNVRTERGVTILDDTYNASVLSVRAALTWAGEQPQRPRVLLTSGILELGRRESALLEEVGTLAAASVERVIFTTTTGRDAFARGFGKPVELLSEATQRVGTGSLLLCVGRMSAGTMNRLLPSQP